MIIYVKNQKNKRKKFFCLAAAWAVSNPPEKKKKDMPLLSKDPKLIYEFT